MSYKENSCLKNVTQYSTLNYIATRKIKRSMLPEHVSFVNLNLQLNTILNLIKHVFLCYILNVSYI